MYRGARAEIAKLQRVLGYTSTSEGALVLSFDEKSQIQALNRTEPGLPTRKASTLAK